MYIRKTWAVCTASMILLSACGGSESKLNLGYLPVKTTENSKWGMIGPDGKLLFEDEFTEQPTMALNGYFNVMEEGGVSVYKAAAKPEIIPGCEELVCAGVMAEGVIPVTRKSERIKLVDASGKEKLTLMPVEGKEITDANTFFSNGILLIRNEEGLWGAIDKSGKVKVSPAYRSLSNVGENLLLATKEVTTVEDSVEKTSEKSLLISSDGNVKTEFKEKVFIQTGFQSGKMIVRMGEDKMGYISTKGEFTKLPGKVNEITGFFNGKEFGFKTEEGNAGVMNIDGDIIIRPKYKDIFLLKNGTYLADNGENKYFILNKEGEKEQTLDDFIAVAPASFFVEDTAFELIGAEKKHQIDLYDFSGKAITQEGFYAIGDDMPRMVSSDYFDPAAIGARIASMIDADGVNGIKFDSPFEKLLPSGADPKPYSNSGVFQLHDIKGGNFWSLNCEVYTDKPISTPIYTTKTERYWFSTYTREVISGYRFTPGNKVTSFSILASSQREFFTEAEKTLMEELAKKGFKALKKEYEDDSTTMQNGNVFVYINQDDGRMNVFINRQTGELSSPEDSIDTTVSDSLAVDSIA